MFSLEPNPPPTSGATTLIWFSGIPVARESTILARWGTWVDENTTNPPCPGSGGEPTRLGAREGGGTAGGGWHGGGREPHDPPVPRVGVGDDGPGLDGGREQALLDVALLDDHAGPPE